MASRDSTYALHRYYTKDDARCSISDMKGDNRTAELRKALEAAIDGSTPGDSSVLAEKVLEALDKQRVFRYHNDGEVSLLSTAGRVLISLLEDQSMTQRAISVYLDLSETMIDKTIKTLISRGLITKTKLNRQNIYEINAEEVAKHPDIQHFFQCISLTNKKLEIKDTQRVTNKPKVNVVDDAPF
jgi:predicted transcriptional regulator